MGAFGSKPGNPAPRQPRVSGRVRVVPIPLSRVVESAADVATGVAAGAGEAVGAAADTVAGIGAAVGGALREPAGRFGYPSPAINHASYECEGVHRVQYPLDGSKGRPRPRVVHQTSDGAVFAAAKRIADGASTPKAEAAGLRGIAQNHHGFWTKTVHRGLFSGVEERVLRCVKPLMDAYFEEELDEAPNPSKPELAQLLVMQRHFEDVQEQKWEDRFLSDTAVYL